MKPFLPLREFGQSLVEYALILVLVAIVIIAILSGLPAVIGNVFSGMVNSTNSSPVAQPSSPPATPTPVATSTPIPNATLSISLGSSGSENNCEVVVTVAVSNVAYENGTLVAGPNTKFDLWIGTPLDAGHHAELYVTGGYGVVNETFTGLPCNGNIGARFEGPTNTADLLGSADYPGS